MQRKISAYQLIAQKSHEDTNHKVNEKLREGWELYGSPFGANEASGRVFHAQAVVKFESIPQFPDDISDLAYVTGNFISDLSEKVSARIKEGWRPVGNLVVTTNEKGDTFCQAMFTTAAYTEQA
jgi:hypothetical protein